MEQTGNKMYKSLYNIPLATAIEWTTNWRNSVKSPTDPDDKTRAFSVNKQELMDVLDDIKPVGSAVEIRFYMGLEIKADGHTQEHLVLVGVDSKNRDLYEEDGVSYVYDFTHPCPSVCDIDSPLYENK